MTGRIAGFSIALAVTLAAQIAAGQNAPTQKSGVLPSVPAGRTLVQSGAPTSSALPPMAPTTFKSPAPINAIPPLPGPLPAAINNRGMIPARVQTAGPAPAVTAASPSNAAAAIAPNSSQSGPTSGSSNQPATTPSPAAGVSSLPPGPLTNAPIGIIAAPNEIRISGVGSSSAPWAIVVLLTFLTLIPSLLICVTPFARILVVFHFLRQALGLQTTPSNQTLIGLTLILTFFIMEPVGKQIYQDSFVPLQTGQITVFGALARSEDPMRNFMAHFVREKDAALFLEIAKEPRPRDIHDLSMRILLPAYIVSELKAGFQIGAVLFLPFLVVDMVVASITTSVGMMQLPPVVISTPLKLLLFLMVDGWHLLIGALMRSFN